VLAARDRLRTLPPAPAVPGPVDPETGEAWDRLNVLGHLAEVLPFWTAQLRGALRGEKFGRDEAGRQRRREGIDAGAKRTEAALRLQIDRGCGRLLGLLERLEDADLGRPLETVRGERQTVREAMEQVLVGHLEEHVEQLRSLS
jgi:hypothetical protein